MKYSIDINDRDISIKHADGTIVQPDSKEAFEVAKKLWLHNGWENKYVYTFTWLGRPIIQLPDDMVRSQEIIYQVKPTLIIETGVAHGGSLIFYASILKMLGKGRVIGIDIDIREHNREAIESHEMSPLIKLIEGSSTDTKTFSSVKEEIAEDDYTLILLDSCHSKEHVLNELRLYADLVSVGSYIVATDGIMEEVVGASRTEEDWTWNNPKEAIKVFLKEDARFILENIKPIFNESTIDSSPTYWPNAWLKRIK